MEELDVKSPVKDEAASKEASYNDILVIFTTIEEGDWSRRDEILSKVNELKDFIGGIGAQKALVYPYAHLSKKLEEPRKAYRLLKLLHKKLSESLGGVEVYRAPFGWYKTFSLTTKPHPMAESYREF